jgi:lysylphosphatidylglycerol synthetase-like protein (DUF2156 family)
LYAEVELLESDAREFPVPSRLMPDEFVIAWFVSVALVVVAVVLLGLLLL